MKKLLHLDLFSTFFKIGLFTFGGGYAMLSLVEHICVQQKQWISEKELLHITIIAESTPGPVAINCASYVGRKNAGLLGACSATLGVVLPSFVIIYLISIFLDSFLDIPLVWKAFQGIKIAVSYLIIRTGLKMFKKCKKSALHLFVFASCFLASLTKSLFSLRFSSIYLILASGVFAFFFYLLTERRTRP